MTQEWARFRFFDRFSRLSVLHTHISFFFIFFSKPSVGVDGTAACELLHFVVFHPCPVALTNSPTFSCAKLHSLPSASHPTEHSHTTLSYLFWQLLFEYIHRVVSEPLVHSHTLIILNGLAGDRSSNPSESQSVSQIIKPTPLHQTLVSSPHQLKRVSKICPDHHFLLFFISPLRSFFSPP